MQRHAGMAHIMERLRLHVPQTGEDSMAGRITWLDIVSPILLHIGCQVLHVLSLHGSPDGGAQLANSCTLSAAATVNYAFALAAHCLTERNSTPALCS